MAETTDRPQVPQAAPPDALMSAEERGAPTPLSSETYQPLSLLALAGFGLAVLYALVVLIGGAVSFARHVPWLMPGWTFLIPAAALAICWVARTHIRRSEGALSGLAFTAWGFRLTVVVGLLYALYYGGTFVAVRLQAIECADRFFALLKQGKIEQAFLFTQGISTKGMKSDEIRNMLESRFNQPSRQAGPAGAFNRFRQEKFIRFIEMDGDKAQIVPRGVASWDHNKDGYRMVLNYHVATSLAEFDMKVETSGKDAKPGDPKGRQWQVVLIGETGVLEPLTLTPLGQEFSLKAMRARERAENWVAEVQDLDKLPPAERDSLSKLVHIDDTFWAGKQQREDILKRVRNTFQPNIMGKPTFNLSFAQKALPLFRESDGRTTVWLDVDLKYLYVGGDVRMPQYTVDGRLKLSAASSQAAESSSAWRVEALEILSGRTPPGKMGPPGGPPNPR